MHVPSEQVDIMVVYFAAWTGWCRDIQSHGVSALFIAVNCDLHKFVQLGVNIRHAARLGVWQPKYWFRLSFRLLKAAIL